MNAEKDIARTTRRWITRVLLVLAIGIPATFLIWRISINSQLDARLARIRNAGDPTNPAELNAWYQNVPDRENVALQVLEAWDEAQQLDPQTEREISDWFRRSAPKRKMSAQLKTNLNALVYSNGLTLKALHEAAGKSRSRYPVDLTEGFHTELRHLGELKGAANLLRSEAYDLLEHDKIDDAAESVRVIYRLAESLSEEPILVSQLVRFAMHAIGNSTAEIVLNRGPVSASQLRSVLTSLEDADSTRGIVRGLAGERAAAIPNFRFQAAVRQTAEDGDGQSTMPRQKVAAGKLVRATGFFERDLCYFLEVMETNLAMAAMPAPDRLKATNELAILSRNARRRLFPLSSMLLPALEKVPLKQAQHEAGVRTARAALAIELYRAEHDGERPAALDALVPMYLKQIPTDPFGDGKALRYRLLEKGYLVYSVGPDGKDDGGKKQTPAKKTFNIQEPFDIAISVER